MIIDKVILSDDETKKMQEYSDNIAIAIQHTDEIYKAISQREKNYLRQNLKRLSEN